jgi:hypothetical protein
VKTDSNQGKQLFLKKLQAGGIVATVEAGYYSYPHLIPVFRARTAPLEKMAEFPHHIKETLW